MKAFINEAAWDRIARIILGPVLLYLGFAVVAGGFGLVVKMLGLLALVTGIVGWCPTYRLIGVSTRKSMPPA